MFDKNKISVVKSENQTQCYSVNQPFSFVVKNKRSQLHIRMYCNRTSERGVHLAHFIACIHVCTMNSSTALAAEHEVSLRDRNEIILPC